MTKLVTSLHLAALLVLAIPQTEVRAVFQAPVADTRQSATPTAAAVVPLGESLMARFMPDARPMGVSVGVVRGTGTLVRAGWGLADRDAKRATTADTSYRLGSASKQFTAALVMRLVERSRVSLDDAVESHLPQIPRKWSGVIVRQLLNHTSGVPDFTDTGSRHWSKTLPPDGLLALVGDDSLQFKPGTKYDYSNSNYVMLAMLAEKYYARPLAQILDEEIAKPLGLTTTQFCEDAYGANGQAGDHTFGTALDWSVRFTFVVENGVATRFTFEQGGARFEGVRKR